MPPQIPGVGNESRLFQALFAGGQQRLDEDERRRQSALSLVRTLAPVGLDTIGLATSSLNQFKDREQRGELAADRQSFLGEQAAAERSAESNLATRGFLESERERQFGAGQDEIRRLALQQELRRREGREDQQLFEQQRREDAIGRDAERVRRRERSQDIRGAALEAELGRDARLQEFRAREEGLDTRAFDALEADREQFEATNEIDRFRFELDRDPEEVTFEQDLRDLSQIAQKAAIDEAIQAGEDPLEAGLRVLQQIEQFRALRQEPIAPQTLDRFQPGGGSDERTATRRLRAGQFFPDADRRRGSTDVPPEFQTPFGQDRRKGVLGNTVDPIGRAIIDLIGGGFGGGESSPAPAPQPAGPREPLFPISPEQREALRRQIKESAFPGLR